MIINNILLSLLFLSYGCNNNHSTKQTTGIDDSAEVVSNEQSISTIDTMGILTNKNLTLLLKAFNQSRITGD